MASLTQWTWVWVNSGSWWWTGRPGVLRFMGLQRVGHGWATELTDWWGFGGEFCLKGHGQCYEGTKRNRSCKDLKGRDKMDIICKWYDHLPRITEGINTHILLEPIIEFSEIAKLKLNIQKSIVLLYPSNNQLENKTWKWAVHFCPGKVFHRHFVFCFKGKGSLLWSVNRLLVYQVKTTTE